MQSIDTSEVHPEYFREFFSEIRLNAERDKSYYFHNNHFCWICNSTEFRSVSEFFRLNPEYIYSLEKKLKYFSLINGNLFFIENYNHTLSSYSVIINKEWPYSTNCYKHYSKFKCLNECAKEHKRLIRYYYEPNETISIFINKDNFKKYDKQYFKAKCEPACPYENCKKVFFFFKSSEINEDIKTIKAIPLMAGIDFWLNLLGLASLFINVSFLETVPRLARLLLSKFRILKHLKHYLNKSSILFKIIIYFICCIFTLAFSLKLIANYNQKTYYSLVEREIISSLTELRPLNLVVCIGIASLIYRKDEDSFYDFFNDGKENYNDKTFQDVEQKTDEALNLTLKTIHLSVHNKMISVDWKVSPVVLFADLDFFAGFSRCFQVKVYPKEPKYYSVLSITKLILRFYDENYTLYLLGKMNSFNSDSFKYKGENYFIRIQRKRSKLNRKVKCVDYAKLYQDCSTRLTCINACIKREFFKLHSKFTIRSVVNKQFFTKDQWANTLLDSSKKNYNQIKAYCENKTKELDCNEEYFEKRAFKTQKVDKHLVELDLYYETLTSIEEEQSIYKLAFDILNIQSVFFNFNLLKLNRSIFNLLKMKFKLSERLYSFFIFLICFLGFTCNTHYILDEILNGELIQNQYYERLNSIEMPDVIFCFDLNQSAIDANHKLRGDYLNEISKEITIESVFEKIKYLNASNEWIKLNLNDKTKKDTAIEIEIFYFLNQKCFLIRLQIDYEFSQFYYNEDSKVLSFLINSSFASQNAYFFTRKRATMQMSKILEIQNFSTASSYSVKYEMFKITLDDKFNQIKNLIKNPSSLFSIEKLDFINVNNYLNQLLAKFNSYLNLRTMNLPLEAEHFNYEINNEIFEQFCNQAQSKEDERTIENRNFKRRLTVNHLNEEDAKKAFNFRFYIFFFEKKLFITNADNWAKLILNLLNLLSLWLNLNILQILNYFSYQIKTAFLKQFKRLLKSKRILFSIQMNEIHC